MTTIPERFLWAVEIMDIQPKDKILEIGCGVGILAEQIGKTLEGGKITAIDRSAAMIRQASKRNRQLIEEGKSEFIQADFNQFNNKEQFNKIVAFNVNFFWKNPEKELSLVRKLLSRKGKLYIFHQAPYDISLLAAAPLIFSLEANGFRVNDTRLKKMKPASCLFIDAGFAKRV